MIGFILVSHSVPLVVGQFSALSSSLLCLFVSIMYNVYTLCVHKKTLTYVLLHNSLEKVTNLNENFRQNS